MRLFLKLALLMVAVGGMSLSLLALRQQRYETSSEISRVHWRILEQERALWRMRADIARRSRPQDIRTAAESLKLDLEPIPHRVVQTSQTESSTN